MTELEKEIEAYVNGEMTVASKKAFEQKVNNDLKLKNEVALASAINTILEEDNWENLPYTFDNKKVNDYESFLISQTGKEITAKIKKAEKSYFKKKVTTRVRNAFLFSGSIAAILIIGFVSILQWDSTLSNESLYATYKDNWKAVPSLTTRGGSTPLFEVEALFRENQFEAAWQILINNMPGKEEEIYALAITYKGIIALELGKNEEALASFDALLQSNTLDAKRAHWYLALTYLKLNDTDKAKVALQKLTGSAKSYNYKKAKALLKKLKLN